MSCEQIKVSGMSCQHCVQSVNKAVAGLAGVQSVDVDLASGLVTVHYNAGSNQRAAFEKAIEDQGYDIVG